MKLVLAVVHRDDADGCASALTGAGVPVTRLQSSGGFLGRGNATLLAGVDASRLDEVVELLRRHAHARVEEVGMPLAVESVGMFASVPVDVEIGGATVFVVDVERFERL